MIQNLERSYLLDQKLKLSKPTKAESFLIPILDLKKMRKKKKKLEKTVNFGAIFVFALNN